MANTLSNLSVVAFILAGVFFVGAIVLFIVLKIPKVIDYFTNRSAKKSVQQMVSSSGASKIASFQTSPGNKARGKTTEQVDIPPPPKKKTGKLQNASPQPPSSGERPETGLLAEKENHTAYLDPTEELVLDLATETESLDEQATSVLPETIEKVAGNRPKIEMIKIDEVILIHTNEVVR